ncbi:MAG: hypothetical protein HFG91_03135 [Acholeplasmatales bacterium]|jgi:hypothetical protein|nr:hypothetical protein [Acholeplasmatales bacterium]MCI9653328.1 hypothetical protein [Acholeplasmatales bacterium]
MQYNLEYHKQLDRSHILPNILEGAKTGVASQFLSDVIISLLLFNESIVLEDIKISTVPSYYASVATGMLAGFLIIYLDPIAVIALTIVFYDYVFEIVDYHINDDPIQFTPVEDLFDIGLTMILVVVFDPTARHQYLRYQQKRRFIEPTLGRQDRSPTMAIFITVLTSTYNFLKIQSDQEENSVITQETMQ